MTTKYLPDEDHVARHVPSQLTTRDDNDNVIGCFPHAFELRPGEKYLSASWLEFFAGSISQCIAAVAASIAATRAVRPRHAFAVGKVGEIKNVCNDRGLRVRIIHEPAEVNPAYTAIRGYRSDELQLLELLAHEVWSKTFEAKMCGLNEYGPWPRR
jgi:hypothetical protein